MSPDNSSAQSTSKENQPTVAEVLENVADGPIYICQASNGKAKGPFTMDEVCAWYEGGQILPSFLISFDGGTVWESIHELRRKNGPHCPFIRDFQARSNSIYCLREITARMKVDVDELEAETMRVEKKVQEEEKELEKLKGKIADREREREMRMKPIDEQLSLYVSLKLAPPFGGLTPPFGPFTILRQGDKSKTASGDIVSLAKELRKLNSNCDMHELEKGTERIFKLERRRCDYCKAGIASARSLIVHISSIEHLEMLAAHDVCGFPEASFEFWRRVLQICQRRPSRPSSR